MTLHPSVVTTPELVVLDFETTGLVPAFDRTIEVAATRLVHHQPVQTFHQLMYPGMKLPSFITSLTGITDAMLRRQPPPEDVMPRLQAFARGLPIVAHRRAGSSRRKPAARVYPDGSTTRQRHAARSRNWGTVDFRLAGAIDTALPQII